MEIRIEPSEFEAGIFDSSYKFPGISVTEKRTVTCYELEFFSESGGTTFINGEGHKLRPGRCICAKPGDIRYTELPIKCFFLRIRPEVIWISEILNRLGAFFRVKSPEKCIGLIKNMLSSEADGDELTRIARLFELLSVVKEAGEQSALVASINGKKNREAVELAIEYMEEHFSEKCTLNDVSAYVHFSPVYFHGLFRSAVGKTPYEYVSRLRLDRAKRLLLTESADISEIYGICGFSSQSYFNYVFKKETGETPSEYRRHVISRYCV